MKRGRKFQEGKLSSACADQFVNRHTSCSMQKCICCCHLSISEQARIKGLRTIAKPGDPDYVSQEAK